MSTLPPASVVEGDLRDAAIRRLKKRRDFHAHLVVFLLVNGFVSLLWVLTSHGFFWPIFIIAFWGIGLVMNAWDVYRGDDFREDQIEAEMCRLQTRR